MEYQKITGRFTCRFCKEQFDLPKSLYTHLQQVHSAASSVKDNRTCPLCGVQCAKYEGYRDHLLYIHGQRTEGQKLTFKSLNEFLLWKTELETKHSCKYILQSSPKILPSNDKKYFYQCDRSESREGKEKKISTVVKKTCPSMISVVESSGNQQFKVEYWNTHSEHKSHSVPVNKDELEAAISSVEMVQAISDDDQNSAKTENLNVSGEANGALSKSLGQESCNKKSFHHVNSSVATEHTSKVKNSFSKANVIKKKATTSSCLYSLASVACMKGISKNSKDSSNLKISNKSKDALGIPVTESSISPKKARQVSDIAESESSSSPNKLKKGDTTPLKPIASKNIIPESGFTSINQVPTIINQPITNNNAFAGQVLLLNPVPVAQNAVNANQNLFPSGQNLIFSFNPLSQNVMPIKHPVLPVDKKGSGEKIIASAEKRTLSPRKKAAGEKIVSEKQNASSVSQPVCTKNNVMNVITNPSVLSVNTDVNTTPGSTVLLSTLPVGSTFMNVNNNLIPIRNSTGAFLSPALNSNIVLAPALPGSVVTSKISSSPVNISPKPTVSTSGVTSCVPIFPAPSPVISTVSGNISKEPKVTSSKTLNAITNKLPVSPATQNRENILPVHNNVTKSTTSTSNTVDSQQTQTTSNQITVNTLELNTIPISSVPSISIPAMHVDSQKPGTLLFESSGNVYMLEPVDNDSNDEPVIIQNDVDSDFNKTMYKENVDTPNFEKSGDTFVKSFTSKRPLTEDDDSSVVQKVKYYQLEMKYLSCQEECKRLKLELDKAEKQNEELSKNLGINFRKRENKKSSAKIDDKSAQLNKEMDDNFGDDDGDVYVMTRSSVLRNLYLEVEELSDERNHLLKDLEKYRNHDRFYRMLRKKLEEEDF